MKIHNCEQNTPEWLALRLGIPTSSEFSRIVTPRTCKLSAQADGYMNRLLAEWATGAPLENETTVWMDRGQELEDSAISAAELILGIETDRVGFITLDSGLVGTSPDRIYTNGKRGVEIKCPSTPVHIAYMRGNKDTLDGEYRCQLAGQMWIAEFTGVDIISYHPILPHVHIPVERDDRMAEFIGLLEPSVLEFVDRMMQARHELDQKYQIEERLADMRASRQRHADRLGVSIADVDVIWEHVNR